MLEFLPVFFRHPVYLRYSILDKVTNLESFKCEWLVLKVLNPYESVSKIIE